MSLRLFTVIVAIVIWIIVLIVGEKRVYYSVINDEDPLHDKLTSFEKKSTKLLIISMALTLGLGYLTYLFTLDYVQHTDHNVTIVANSELRGTIECPLIKASDPEAQNAIESIKTRNPYDPDKTSKTYCFYKDPVDDKVYYLAVYPSDYRSGKYDEPTVCIDRAQHTKRFELGFLYTEWTDEEYAYPVLYFPEKTSISDYIY